MTMEQMPYQPHAATSEPCNTGHKVFPPAAATTVPTTAITTSDWKTGLPVLHGQTMTLRELTLADAPSLFALLTTEEVSRFISPPPTTLAGFEKFIAWTHAQRQAGKYACFAVVPEGMDTAIGIFQVRALESGFGTAEWGFALGSPFWGRGYFADGAAQVLAFAFDTVGVHRLEARSSVENLRGNGALRKAGAAHEGTLRQSFLKDGRRHDQNLWTMLDTDWQARGARPSEASSVPTATRTDFPHTAMTPTSRVH
jgi:ribosomal-protein-alanine N-acetyltransferase